MNKGFVILAQNTKHTDYISCAEVLAHSLKRTMPHCSVSLITDNIVESSVFDNVIPLPYGDLDPDGDWKLLNDWQVYEASPYEYTIKLEADIFIPYSIDYWWDVLCERDVVVSTTIRNFKGEVSDVKYYRQFIYDNKLPDAYNAITYFKKSKLAEDYFKTVRAIFENWEDFKAAMICHSKEGCTTDWAYAIACQIHGAENTTLPMFTQMSMVHMKKMVNTLLFEDWRHELMYEFTEPMKIVSHPQLYPIHYYVKDFCKELKEAYA